VTRDSRFSRLPGSQVDITYGSSAAVTPNGRMLAFSGADSAWLYDTRYGVMRKRVHAAQEVIGIGFSPNGRRLTTIAAHEGMQRMQQALTDARGSGNMLAGIAAMSRMPGGTSADLMKPVNGKTAAEVIALANQYRAEANVLEEKGKVEQAANDLKAKAEAAAQATMLAAYLPKLDVRHVSTRPWLMGATPYVSVEGELKNMGERTLESVELTARFLDAEGKAVRWSIFSIHPSAVGAGRGAPGVPVLRRRVIAEKACMAASQTWPAVIAPESLPEMRHLAPSPSSGCHRPRRSSGFSLWPLA